MHIKKLEICGFKSFVDRTVVHFDHDMIGVVGPNGCGKSNIVDAIRWCMGEQSAKHLRGRSMEDVIFNGSESRPQHGLAEVTLTFNNSDPQYAKTLPEAYQQYPEIAVTRRLFRDGTSEYLINKTQVRLRDITELFLGTGVGTKAYSIVEQGRVGQIVSSRPVDRRAYIEEAAGITKYKLRRKQAERKMDQTRQNLVRINDIVGEIDRSRNSLKRQAAKAERYIAYREELEDLFLHDASHRLLEMIVMERVEAASLTESQGQVDSVSTELKQKEEALIGARESASAVEIAFEEATRRGASTEQRELELKSTSERAQDRLAHQLERVKTGSEEEAELRSKLDALTQEHRALAQRIEMLTADAADRKDSADEEEGQLAALQQAESEAGAALNALSKRASELRSEAASDKTRAEVLGERAKDARERAERAAQQHGELETELQKLTSVREDLALRVDQVSSVLKQAQSTAERLEAEAHEQKPRVQQARETLDGLTCELHLRQSRLKALRDLHQRLEGVGAGTKALLSSNDPAVLGMLADRLEVAPGYTDALAGLLGDRLQCVIVDDPARGLELLEQLRTSKGGRATIAGRRLPAAPQAATNVPSDELVLCRLIDQLTYNEADAALIEALVGATVVVDNATDALTLNQRQPGALVVALDGTVVRECGLVSGGAGDDVAAAMVEQKREIRDLTAVVSELESKRQQMAEDLAGHEKRSAALEDGLRTARQALHAAELSHVSVENDSSRTNAESERLTKRFALLQTEMERFAQAAEEFDKDVSDSIARVKAIADEEVTLAGELEAAEALMEQRKAASTEKTGQVTERRIRLAQVREQLESATAAQDRVEGAEAEATERLTRLAEELTSAAQVIGETAATLVLTKRARIAAQADCEDAQQLLSQVRVSLEQSREGLNARESELGELRVGLAGYEEEVREAEMSMQRRKLERDHLVQKVAERFRGLDLPSVVGDYHARPAPDPEHRRRIDELTRLIDRMGPVNLEAKTEYEDAERRFDELNDQKVDIEASLLELERAIRHMDRESKRRFRETFDAVNQLFKQTFIRLFKGGRGELRLTDPDNLLETGVDIIAQPPGKKLGNIELMSGGEKALTATALIFSMFQHRPSPFCVLDEVDAPLDEANVSRYADAVRAMTSHSQFILITHIKKTMQMVDVLYGVTMGEPGVSRIVSVKVNDQAQSRSERATSALPEQKPSSGGAVA